MEGNVRILISGGLIIFYCSYPHILLVTVGISYGEEQKVALMEDVFGSIIQRPPFPQVVILGSCTAYCISFVSHGPNLSRTF